MNKLEQRNNQNGKYYVKTTTTFSFSSVKPHQKTASNTGSCK